MPVGEGSTSLCAQAGTTSPMQKTMIRNSDLEDFTCFIISAPFRIGLPLFIEIYERLLLLYTFFQNFQCSLIRVYSDVSADR
jgi:hypothetical protein